MKTLLSDQRHSTCFNIDFMHIFNDFARFAQILSCFYQFISSERPYFACFLVFNAKNTCANSRFSTNLLTCQQ